MNTNQILGAGLLAAAMTLTQAANAMSVYEVSSTPNINCGNDPHGLWTNNYNSSGCEEYYDFLQPGSTLTVDGATAVLEATAMNEAGVVATIDITFGGFMETYPYYKNGGTPDYNGTDNPVDWDFFTYITAGTISFSNGDMFDILLVNQPGAGIASPSSPVLQIGDGANDKSSGLGASAWLDAYTANGDLVNGHWDLNMSLSLIPGGGGSVPAPGTVALLGLGLLGLAARRRRRA